MCKHVQLWMCVFPSLITLQRKDPFSPTLLALLPKHSNYLYNKALASLPPQEAPAAGNNSLQEKALLLVRHLQNKTQ